MKSLATSLVILSAGIVIGAGGYWAAHTHAATQKSIFTITSEKDIPDGLTSPLLDCEINEGGALQAGLVPFGTDLKTHTESLVQSGKAQSIAVYYRDLSNGPWLGVNEQDAFLPASLLKVPVMIAYFKAAETDPDILTQKIRFEEEMSAPDGGEQRIKPSQELEVGKEYTALDLIERSIIYSDNQAVQLLYKHIEPVHVFNVYRRIGVDTKSIEGPGAVLSPREYSAFFRVLYNASYLNREMSEKALEILTRVEQKRGLVAGVPQGTVVAHKFGEAGFIENNAFQYHDCGIVYHPKRDYLLCVMTRGENVDDLMSTIQSVSEFVWQKVDSQVSASH